MLPTHGESSHRTLPVESTRYVYRERITPGCVQKRVLSGPHDWRLPKSATPVPWNCHSGSMDRLPSEVVTPRLLLRRWRPEDVPPLSAAIEASLDHLRPWMAWVRAEPLSDHDRTELIVSWDREWENGGDRVYGVFRDGVIVGGCGLHRRRAPNTLEIGYWIHVDHVRQGYATELASGLTTAAFGVRGIDRVEIHHDKANMWSAAVPRSLGFTRGPEQRDEVQAPAEIGIDCSWSISRLDWHARRPQPHLS